MVWNFLCMAMKSMQLNLKKKKKSYKRQKESGEQCLIEIRGQVLQCKSIKNTNMTAPLKNRYHE